jgi:hypothetical protein
MVRVFLLFVVAQANKWENSLEFGGAEMNADTA